MRRLQAILLLIAISFPLIALPLLSSAPGAKLPQCCRRDGKHKCAMKGMAGSKLSLSGIGAKCPLYPAGKASPATAQAAIAVPVLPVAGPALAPAAVLEQPETLYRISYHRARQKRGPPASLLS